MTKREQLSAALHAFFAKLEGFDDCTCYMTDRDQYLVLEIHIPELVLESQDEGKSNE